MKIYEKPCSECLFHNNRLTTDATAKKIVRRLKQADTHFVCHKATITDDEVMCRGQYNAVERGELPPPQMLRIAERLRCVRFVPLPDIKDVTRMTVDERAEALAKLRQNNGR